MMINNIILMTHGVLKILTNNKKIKNRNKNRNRDRKRKRRE